MHNQGQIYTGTVLSVYSDNTLRVKYEVSVITGEDPTLPWFTNPDPLLDEKPVAQPLVDPNPRLHETTATINTTFVSTSSFMYKQMDPVAVYVIGDKVAVYQHWVKLPKQELTYKFYVIGKWRGTTTDNNNGEFPVNN
jgi:hypothetical protein